MAMPGPLKDEFSRYKKSKTRSIDGSVSGVPYNRFRRPTTPPLGSGNARPAGYHHELYMHGVPGEYRPNINAPSVDWGDYDTYEPGMPDFSRGSTERRSHGFNIGTIQPGFHSMPTDDLALTELFLQAMGSRGAIEEIASDKIAAGMTNKDLEGFVDSGGIPDFKDLAVAFTQLSKIFPQDHPDIVNLKNAMHELSDDGQLSVIEKNPSEVREESSFNPHLEASQIFEQQMRFFEKSQEFPVAQKDGTYSFSITGEISAGEFDLEEIIEQEIFPADSPVPFAEPEMMQQGISEIENQDMAFSQIEQAINQVTEQPLPEEPDQFYMQPDPFMVAECMFDPQYMPNYMMPGQMPFGSMGMMPGPM